MKFCTKCIMPDTRPHITFNKEGICIACQNNEKKKTIDWDERYKELEELCNKYRRKTPGDYDCIIAVSGGKDSHYQVHVMKELMNMYLNVAMGRRLCSLRLWKRSMISRSWSVASPVKM